MVNIPDITRQKIQLVGAGPGDPELLTLKALRAIQEADIVLADRLVSKEILNLVQGEIKIARKRCGKADLAQAELDAWGLQALREGKRVVRLKNGDPFLFGRGAEEAIIFSQHGFEVEIIPGISSSLAAPLSAGIPVTMRDVADQVLICTGHGKHDRFPSLPEYCEHRTTVFLMAIGRLRKLCMELTEEKGYPANLPAAIIHAATTSNSLTIRSSLANIADVAESRGIKPPGTLVLGNAVYALCFLQNFSPVADTVNDSRNDLDFRKPYEISYAPLSIEDVETSNDDLVEYTSKYKNASYFRYYSGLLVLFIYAVLALYLHTDLSKGVNVILGQNFAH